MRLLLLVAALVAACGVQRPVLPEGPSRFTALPDGTVRDVTTGLVWSGNGNLPGFREPFDGATWADAEAFVAAMNHGERTSFGHDDWRLPSANELKTLFTGFWRRRSWLACQADGIGSACSELVPFAPFVDLQPGSYWSATPVEGTPDRMWAVETRRIAVPTARDGLRRVLPVRGPAYPPDQ